MTPAQALQTLADHQHWRRSETDDCMIPPRVLGQAIDIILARMPALEDIADIAAGLSLMRDDGGRGYYAVQGCGKDAELLAEALKALDEKEGT
jgi:hypothetical protein